MILFVCKRNDTKLKINNCPKYVITYIVLSLIVLLWGSKLFSLKKKKKEKCIFTIQ